MFVYHRYLFRWSRDRFRCTNTKIPLTGRVQRLADLEQENAENAENAEDKPTGATATKTETSTQESKPRITTTAENLLDRGAPSKGAGSRQPAAPRNNHRNIHVIRKRPTESKPTARRTRWKPKKAIQKVLEKTANLDQEIFLNNTTTTNYEGKALSPKPTRASAAPRPTSVTRLAVQPRGTKARGSLRKAAKARHGRQSILIEYMYM